MTLITIILTTQYIPISKNNCIMKLGVSQVI